MGLLSWLFAKKCNDGEHSWATETTTSGNVFVYCRDCGTGK